MTSAQPNLFLRSDTFFGVCEAIGEDLRIPANLLRIAFAPLLFWNPMLAFGLYAGLGLIVALSRWLAPNPKILEAPVAADAAEPAGELQPAENEAQAQPMPLAA